MEQKQSSNFFLATVAAVALVSIVALVALVLNAGSGQAAASYVMPSVESAGEVNTAGQAYGGGPFFNTGSFSLSNTGGKDKFGEGSCTCAGYCVGCGRVAERACTTECAGI